jgi:hypothetical protein
MNPDILSFQRLWKAEYLPPIPAIVEGVIYDLPR